MYESFTNFDFDFLSNTPQLTQYDYGEDHFEYESSTPKSCDTDLTECSSSTFASVNSSNSDCEKRELVGCRKRKSFTPRRSPPLHDPSFRGVLIKMENKFINNEWKLVINSKFQLSPKKKRMFIHYIESSDEEDSSTYACVNTEVEKHCASCSVKKTPLWRDAEDGTPLCNACGIRYKKYKLRCGTCWHIPKKDEFSPACRFCGSFYEYVSPRR
ncbi:GATA-type zinc finger protein 1-like [Uloborus diversus]|uniref:GATA-type zinc finger protein 1-like n=1 Tax=Uloborus diversus TaxID=327109 RepID=UPI00240967A3|nr:GATA-type zinc finger protein 1-like [Uloborus diversus]